MRQWGKNPEVTGGTDAYKNLQQLPESPPETSSDGKAATRSATVREPWKRSAPKAIGCWRAFSNRWPLMTRANTKASIFL